MKFRHFQELLLIALCACATFAMSSKEGVAQIVLFDEVASGLDLGTAAAPTSLGTLAIGTGTVSGTVTGNGQATPFDQDAVSFTIAAGTQLDSITLLSYVSGDDVGAARSFAGILESSSIATLAASSFDDTQNGGLLGGGSLIGTVGQDILSEIGSASLAGNGFTGPLGPGTYTLVHQETVVGNEFSFGFNVSSVQAVPEPSSAALLSGLALLGFVRRRRS